MDNDFSGPFNETGLQPGSPHCDWNPLNFVVHNDLKFSIMCSVASHCRVSSRYTRRGSAQSMFSLAPTFQGKWASLSIHVYGFHLDPALGSRLVHLDSARSKHEEWDIVDRLFSDGPNLIKGLR
jgi:hypothetical protein